jgi:hypothetical protein
MPFLSPLCLFKKKNLVNKEVTRHWLLLRLALFLFGEDTNYFGWVETAILCSDRVSNFPETKESNKCSAH